MSNLNKNITMKELDRLIEIVGNEPYKPRQHEPITKVAYEKIQHNNDLCWETGNYTDNCSCYICIHKYECSGSEKEDND